MTLSDLHKETLAELTRECQELASKTLEDWMGPNRDQDSDQEQDGDLEPEYHDDEDDEPKGLVHSPLDVRLVVNRDGTVRGAQLLMAFGAPNIWVDTEKGQVEGYWGDHVVEIPFDLFIAREITEYFDERTTVEIAF